MTVEMHEPGFRHPRKVLAGIQPVSGRDGDKLRISQLANRFVSDPNTVAQVNQQVKVTLLEVDIPRRRIALSMKVVPSGTT